MEALTSTMFTVSAAGSVASLGYLIASVLFARDDKKITDRLQSGSDQSKLIDRTKSGEQAKKLPLAKRLAGIFSQPFMPEKASTVGGLRARLARAGIYDPAAVRSFIGYKFILLTAGLVVGYFAGALVGQSLLGLAFGGIMGYLAPQFWLSRKITDNQQSISIGLPDALDLMVICVESGLTIDAAMARVGDELSLAHPVIAREFGIAHTETRLGVPRREAFKNLAARTGNPNLQSLAAMLIQADKFGTSIAFALRIQAESMRIKRQMAAEELAAKASVKLTFPLVLFIFPATFVVMGGPMAIDLMSSPLFQ